MMVVTLQQQGIICTSNDVSRVSGNTDIDYGGGGSSPARAVIMKTCLPICLQPQ